MESVAQDGEQINVEDDPEDVEPTKMLPNPKLPPLEEIERHRIDHTPFRSWCKWCAMGRALGLQHKSQKDGSSVPRIGLDYFFITDAGVQKRDELGIPEDEEGSERVDRLRREGKIIKCILVRCWETKNIFAHVVPRKGADEEGYTASLVAADIAWIGHQKLILKTDNEASIKALMKQVMDVMRTVHPNVENVTAEHPAPYDSQSNGGT